MKEEQSDRPNGVKEASPTKSERSPPRSQAMSIDTTARPPSSPAVRTVGLPDDSGSENETEQPILTAIYRPDSKAAWREELRAANAKAEKARIERRSTDEEQLANLTLSVDDEELPLKPEDAAEKVWTSRRSLKSHLDVVRALAFAQGPSIMLASGGDDNTVKVWSVEASSIMSSK